MSAPPKAPHSKELRGGRYALLGKLGAGSQGETYEAIDHGAGSAPRGAGGRAAPLAEEWARYVRDKRGEGEVPRKARLVAIKCFRIGAAKAWKDVELAEREARTLASLDHPHLPRYFEHFEEDGALYLVMEKIEGESLAALRARGATMSAAQVQAMLEDIGGALRYLHQRAPAVVHRDIKPGNIVRRPDGSFALVDFGAVRDRLKPAGGSTVVGTFGYMAPEQFQGRASPGSDVYGLGATAMTMLTGTDPEDLHHEGLGIDVVRSLPRGTPAPLVRALKAMLVADPDLRVGSIEDALALLRGEDRRGEAREGEREAPPRTPRSSRKLNRKERRALDKQRGHARKLAKRERRAATVARRAPLVPRVLARLGLFVALLVVWLTVGVVVPAVLVLLSLLFGASLRRAASACVRAARGSQAALGRASMWLSGHRLEVSAPVVRARVAEEPPRVRAALDAEGADAESEGAEAPAEEADAWLEDRLEQEAQRERMRLHARAPKTRRFWGRSR